MERAAVPPTLEDVHAEGVRLAEAAREAGLPLKLMGGVGVWVHCPSARSAPLARLPADVDFASRARRRQDVSRFLESEGYLPDKLFNALHGASRLNFADPARHRPVDVILDRFAMCHAIDLRDRLDGPELAVAVTDLLLMKLQIVEINEKDVRDALAILLDHATDHGPAGIDLDRIRAVTRDDWGFEHTIRLTMALLAARAGESGLTGDQVRTARARIEEILRALDVSPKGVKWKLRAAVGERVRWYETPEEVRR